MEKQIVGRQAEIETLSKILHSEEAEFLAIYGRRRIGKTYLIRQYFRQANCTFFEVTGKRKGSLKAQLATFKSAFEKVFLRGYEIAPLQSWQRAFDMLTDTLKKTSKHEKIILFFDELPWLVTRRSQLMQTLDHVWNTEWSELPNVKLIVCGSAASWMLKHFIYTKGGLHNRITARINLRAFTLQEVKNYLIYRNIHLNNQQIVELYMATGGVPFYLNSVEKGLSAAQNINNLCFTKEGILFEEFNKLYQSLFDKSEMHIEIIRAIAAHREGASLEQILHKAPHATSGGAFKERLDELESSGFIQGFSPYEAHKKGTYYKIYDEYTYFYLQWIEGFRPQILSEELNIWVKVSQTPRWHNWAGYAFESICFKNITNIRKSLGLEAILAKTASFRYTPKSKTEKGIQIDLLFDRADKVITLCEIKYCVGKFTIDKNYAENLANKLQMFRHITQTTKQIFLVLITPFGLNRNEYSDRLVFKEITMDEFF